VRERGAATVVVVSLISGLVLVTAGLVDVSRLVAARAQAVAAADAAALAAAPVTFFGGDPVAEAAALADRNGARLEVCRCPLDRSMQPRLVTVEVSAAVDLALLGSHTVQARSAAEFVPLQLLTGG